MKNVVVVGSQWGDEGKGKIVDWLSDQADVVIRFQGGHNAGHTLVIDGVTYKLRLLPSGIVRKNKISIIGNGVVVDPWALLEEIEEIKSKGVKVNKIVLDPVMVAKGGTKLIDDEAIKLLKKELINRASLITPNIPEAEILTGIKIKTKEDMIYAASILIRLGAKNVFIKGGHLDSRIVQDIFVNKEEIMLIKNKRITTSNTHGTGCTLSSAITTFFACGKTLKKSCELATKYVNNSIRSNLNYGKGHGPINHLSSIIIDKKFR